MEIPDGPILVADDEPYIREMLQQLLERAGYTVVCAKDGMAAVALARKAGVHLAILDIQMDRLDGIGALKKIKACDPAVEVLIITGNADIDSLRASIVDNGAFDYILKPFYKDELLNTVRNALMKRAYLLDGRNGLLPRLNRLEAEFEERTRQLRESQIQYREMVENSGDSIMIVREGRLPFANANMSELTGYRPAEIQQLPLETLIHPEDREAVRRYYTMLLESRHTPAICRFRFLRKSGGAVWVEAANKRTRWREQPAVLSFCRDITERKKAEEELEMRVRQRTDQLSRANARLREEIGERKEVEADLKGLLKKQDLNIELAKRILGLINGQPARHLPLPGNRSLFVREITLPCQAQGGDHFFLRTVTRKGENRSAKTVISLKDQSGHAVNCVLRSIGTDLIHQSLLQRLGEDKLERTMGRLDSLIRRSRLFGGEDFVTGITAEIDHHPLALRYLSNGHPPFLMIRGRDVRLLGGIDDHGANAPLAWGGEAAFSEAAQPLRTGDRLIFFTDGLNEMPQHRLNRVIRFRELREMAAELATPASGVAEIMEQLLDRIARLSRVTAGPEGDNTSGDDITLVGVEVEDDRFTASEILRPRGFEEMASLISALYSRIEAEWGEKGFEAAEMRLCSVLEETLWNAWKHGNGKDPDKSVTVRWRYGNDFVLEVGDEGSGFVHCGLPDPRRRENRTKECGRGIFFIRHFADAVSWDQDGRVIRVGMGKRPTPRPRDGPGGDHPPLDLWEPLP
jgi:PAS domain S-box-containing protein